MMNTFLAHRFGTSWPQTIYWGVAGAMCIALAVTLVIQASDSRTLDGHISVWTKPLKFELSLLVHAASLALVTGLLSPAKQQGALMMVIAGAFLAACVIEMGYIILQGARAEQSHFNVATPFHKAMYAVMAFCAVIIIGAAGAIGLVMLGDNAAALTPALRIAIILGLVGGTVLTLVTAFAIGGRMSPFVGGTPAPELRMLLTGWSQTSGDLRVSHFLATHMIQAVPIAALLFARIAPDRTAVVVVVLFAVIWTALTVYEFRTALAGEASILTRYF